ncbi:NAD-dependent epimerase/dehydratase family protein, partial [bacterium]|nr:NAD-dependent epimerase/dehydratase family protein [bacterium]
HLLRVYGACYGIKTVALRYFNVFGPRQADDSPYTGVIAIFVRELLQGRTPTIYGDGGQTRDFTFVDNVVAANLAALECDAEPGVVVNVGGAERVSLNDLYKVIAAELGGPPEPGRGPERAGDIRHSLASIDRARELLGFEPSVQWEDGLRRTLDWYRDAASASQSS